MSTYTTSCKSFTSDKIFDLFIMDGNHCLIHHTSREKPPTASVSAH